MSEGSLKEIEILAHYIEIIKIKTNRLDIYIIPNYLINQFFFSIIISININKLQVLYVSIYAYKESYILLKCCIYATIRKAKKTPDHSGILWMVKQVKVYQETSTSPHLVSSGINLTNSP